jgi:hypothetical protein
MLFDHRQSLTIATRISLNRTVNLEIGSLMRASSSNHVMEVILGIIIPIFVLLAMNLNE